MTTAPAPSAFRHYLLVLTVVFLIIFATMWWWVIHEPFAYMRVDYPIWMAKMKMADEPHRVVILGDSAAISDLIPARLGPDVVNLALGGTTPIENYFVARRLLKTNPPPETVLISFAPYQLSHVEWFWRYGVEYGLLDYHDIDEVRRDARSVNDTIILGPPSPGEIDIRLKAFLNSIQFPPYYFASLVTSGGFLRSRENHERWNGTLASRGQNYYGLAQDYPGRDAESYLSTFRTPKLVDIYLDKMLALFQEHHVQVYFVSMPRNENSLSYYTPEFKSRLTDYLDYYTNKYPNFHLLNDPFTPYPSDCFGDSHHLNPKGAPLWSDEVAKKLNEAHAPGGPFGPN